MPSIRIGDKFIKCSLVLFDLDGTLVDKDFRNVALAKTRYNAIKRIAGEPAAKRWAELSGVELPSFSVDDNGPLSKAPRKEDLTVATTAIWLDRLNWFNAKELATKAYAEADAAQSTGFKAELIPGTVEALKEMRKAGIRLGIATNGSGKTARELMEAINVDALFDVYVGADEVTDGKPMPDMIIEACSRLDVAPSDSVYVGDELVDAIAATRANCAGVVIVSREPDVSEYTEFVVDSIADIRVG
ncbi:MAG: HAD family hydrolase [Candidatus Bathyarchaeota archaeon]|nr:HAD family hydrolase [Candidatus Bathyarchaeota archaeon]